MNKNNEILRIFVYSKLNDIDNLKKPKHYEIEIYNFTIRNAKEKNIDCSWTNKKFKQIYLQKYRSIIQNLKRDNSLVNMKPRDLINTHVWDLAPHIWEPVKKKVDLMRDTMKITCDEDNEGMYTCKKCKSKNTTFITLQTRSADEPMTIYITCQECENHWKE